jgi:hypothetical protein
MVPCGDYCVHKNSLESPVSILHPHTHISLNPILLFLRDLCVFSQVVPSGSVLKHFWAQCTKKKLWGLCLLVVLKWQSRLNSVKISICNKFGTKFEIQPAISEFHKLHRLWQPLNQPCISSLQMFQFKSFYTLLISLCQGCTNPGHQVVMVAKFCSVAPNICGSSIWNLL